MRSIDPTTGEVIAQYDEMAAGAVSETVGRAHSVFEAWRSASFADRGGCMRRAARLLHERRDALAPLMTGEMGKPIVQSRAEIEKCAWACEYYAGNAEKFLSPESVRTESRKSYVRFDPI